MVLVQAMWRYVASMRLSRLVVSIFLLSVFILIIYHLVTNGALISSAESSTRVLAVDADSEKDKAHLKAQSEIARRTLGLISDEEWQQATELCPAANSEMGPGFRKRLEELLRVKQSVQIELRGLEKQRTQLQVQVAAFHRKIEELKTVATKEQLELERLRSSIRQAKLAQEEFTWRNTPEIRAPISLQASIRNNVALRPPIAPNLCADVENCFDYSRCSLTSGFPIHLYADKVRGDKSLLDILSNSNFKVTSNPDRACVFVVVVDENVSPDAAVEGLSHWNGDGRNHILWSTSGADISGGHNRALIVQPHFDKTSFRFRFDVVAPFHTPTDKFKVLWNSTVDLLPLHRKYIITFEGKWSGISQGKYAMKLLRLVQNIDTDDTEDHALIDHECPHLDQSLKHYETQDEEFLLCRNMKERANLLMNSTFVLIIVPLKSLTTHHFQIRLTEALRYGAIPVIVGHINPGSSLPFSEVVNWHKAAVIIPAARLPELHFLMRSFTDADLFTFRRQGNLIWRNYLATPAQTLITSLHIIRERLLIPPPITVGAPSPSAFEGATRALMDQLPPDLEPVEPLGPLEQPKSSVSFRRNFSTVIMDSNERWNNHFDAFFLPPYSPFEPFLPTDAKFRGSFQGFRPIGEGCGGAGREFSQAIGGNVASEQFTVVILTYEREQVLIDALVRLYGLPFLNKVVVVWNSELPPSPDLKWPDIGVPIEVIKTSANSLNNRFLPYNVIQTEAVLSVDDDAHLRHDEIIFAFRVWRENRERLVGFPGRFHAWDKEHSSWNYNSNYSCELSMVLTGAAFYHNYYNYYYSQYMASEIREKVDEYMNCEDIAMNFLVSHITRKPPVKVTSRWTFRCPGCPVSLWEEDSHFQERHECINYFKDVYGYMPLLYTQYRADSVLFKTRIPADKQKCFKFI